MPRSPSDTISPGCDLAQQLGADDVERAALGGDAVAVAEPAERQRPQAGAVAEGDDRVLGHDDRREGALELRHDVGERVLDALGLVGGEQRGYELGVGGAAELDAAIA